MHPSQPESNRTYVLGSSPHEFDRLIRQGQALESMTRRLFEEAGIRPGTNVLDLGSGSGDVALLLSQLVGPSGSVTSIDVDPAAIELSQARAAAAGVANISFVQADISQLALDTSYDAIVGRYIFLYLADPGLTLARLAKRLRPGGPGGSGGPGGIVAFLEPWLTLPQGPPNPLQQVAVTIMETMKCSGARIDQGVRLHHVFREAGLPQPQMRYEGVLDPSEDSPLHQLFADSYLSLLPAAEKYGMVSPDALDPAVLPQLLRMAMSAAGYATMMFPTVCAWSRK